MIRQWIESYKPQNIFETEQALREIMQEIALAGLYRANFFNHAAFYGGTSLRIFHDLNRFSEDLDFSLLKKDTTFQIQPYLNIVIEEFQSLGIKVSITQKTKSSKTNIDSAFLKSDTYWHELIFEDTIPQINLSMKPSIKIKLEVDINPPLGFETESLLLTLPYSFYVNCFKLPFLFAGKMHALLFRKWKNRVKGRDWYDLEWYIRKGVALNVNHLCARAIDSGDWNNEKMSKNELLELLHVKIDSMNFNQVKEDVIRFIPNPDSLNIWSETYFLQLIEKLKIEEI
jgi:predicted nucleotidyltransferase component of viral defense system